MAENAVMAQVKVPVDLEESVKVPYIIKDKLLMSPGIWNDLYYSAEEIHNAFLATKWDDKTVRSLFSDHADFSSTEWIGEVINVHEAEGGKILGDLVIVDKPTAMKLAYGAKMGISPKVHGRTDETKILNFKFNNFSVVINPAIKTAYINNSQRIIIGDEIEVTMDQLENAGFEEIREKMGMSPEEFYAIPRDPPSSSKLPIFDAAHVRNALARFSQMKDVSAEEKEKAMKKIEAAAKKFNVTVGQQNVAENKKEENTMVEEQQNVPEKVIADAAHAAEQAPAGASMESLAKQMDAMMGMLKQIMDSYASMTSVKNEGSYGPEVTEGVVPAGEDEKKGKKKKKEEVPVAAEMAEEQVAKLGEKDQVIAELSEKLKLTEAKLNEPVRDFIVPQGVTYHELSQKELAHRNADLEFMSILKNTKR